MNEDQLAAVDAARLLARELGGADQVALFIVTVGGSSAMRAAGMPEEKIHAFLDAVAVLIRHHPDPVAFVDRHAKLMAGLGDSLRMLRDDA